MIKKSLVDELSEDRTHDEEIIKSFEPKDSLSPDIFKLTNGKLLMDASIRNKLLSIADKFIEFLGVDFFIHDVILTGSIANFNWSQFSDIDIHIIIDYEESNHNVDLLKEFFDAKRRVWNFQQNIKLKGYDVELYVQDLNEKHISSGVYSILHDTWLVVPQKSKQKIDDRKILEKGEEYAKTIDDLIQQSKKEDVDSEVNELKRKLKRFRQSGLDSGGEFSYENLTYKLLRRNGYIQKLINLNKTAVNDKLSLNENFKISQENINEILSGYIQAALFTEEERLNDENREIRGVSFDDEDEDDDLEKLIRVSNNNSKEQITNFTRDDIEPDSLIKAYTDIIKFLHLAGESVYEAIETNGYERLGMDIWYTRNGHGSGFFDHSYSPENEEKLISAGKSLGMVDLYINNQMKLSFSNEHLYESLLNESHIFSDRDILRVEKEAIKHYGETYSFRPAGFITPSGYLLDFGQGSGGRVQDHRNIAYILEILNIDLGEYDTQRLNHSPAWGMYAVLDMGFIRIIAESRSIHMVRPPTQDQYVVIRKMINEWNGAIRIQINTNIFVQHQPDTPEDFIIEGIKRFFSYGEIPKSIEDFDEEML